MFTIICLTIVSNVTSWSPESFAWFLAIPAEVAALWIWSIVDLKSFENEVD